MSSLHENATEKSQTMSETVPTDRKQNYRLYPSQATTDKCSTAEVCAPRRSTAGEKLPAAAAAHHSDTLSDASTAARSQVRMKSRILTLEEQRQELLSINERWAKEYRTMSHYYTEKVEGLKALLRHDRCLPEAETCEEGGKDVDGRGADEGSAKTGDATVSSGLLRAEKEARDLRAQNGTLTRKGRRQREEIARLNKALEEALRTARPLQEESGGTPHDVWKHQAEVYKEDFLKERRDREKLKEKSLELEKKLREVHRELRVLRPQVTTACP